MKSPNFERKKLTHSISACHYHGTDQVSNKLGAKKGNVAQNTTLNLLKRWINSTFDKVQILSSVGINRILYPILIALLMKFK